MLGVFTPGSSAPGWYANAFSSSGATVSDTAATISDTIASLRTRSAADTASTASDSVSISFALGRSVTDTALTVTDLIALSRNISTVSVALALSDSLEVFGHPVLSDTGATVTDTLKLRAAHVLTDTGTTISDSVSRVQGRALTDTGATISSSLACNVTRSMVDTGANISADSVDAGTGVFARNISDQGATVTDEFGLIFPRTVSDTAATVSDSVQLYLLRKLADTGTTITSALARSPFVQLVDTAVTLTDAFLGNDFYRSRTMLLGASGTVAGTTVGATFEAGEYRPYSGYGHTVWYQWTCPVGGKYRFRVRPGYPANGSPPLADAWMALYEYDAGAVQPTFGKLVMWCDTGSWYDLETYQNDDVMVNFVAETGQQFVIQVGARQASGTTTYWFPFDLEWQPITAAPTADDFPGRVLANGQIVTGNPEWATAEPGDPWYWIRNAPYPLSNSFWTIDDPYPYSNRTMIYKFTPDAAVTTTITFYEDTTPGAETGELAYWLFDGDGVTDVSDLTLDKRIASAYWVYSGDVFSFVPIAGRDYYLWVASDDGTTGPENRHKLRVKWASGAAPANDLPESAVDLDDGLWHLNQSTDGATWEALRSQGYYLTNPSDTVWYRYSVEPARPVNDTVVAFKDMSYDIAIERYQPVRIDETALAVTDVAATISDTISVLPLRRFDLVDTGVTLVDTVAKTGAAARAIADTGATIIDLGISGAVEGGVGTLFDIGATISDSVSRKIARRMSDFAGNQFGSGVAGSHNLVRNPLFRGRPLADTGATISDSLATLNLVRFDLADTAATVSDTLSRAQTVWSRTIIATGVTLTDQLTRIPPVTVVDTGVTVSDSVARVMLLRGRKITDDAGYYNPGTYEFITRTKTRVRTLTDTAATVSDGLS